MNLSSNNFRSSDKNMFLIVQLRFIFSILKIILLICIYFTKDEYIFSGLSMSDERNGDNYSKAAGIFMSGITLFMISLIVELLIQFTGYTVRHKKNNLICLCLNIFSIMLLVFYILGGVHFLVIWYIFIFTQIPNTLLEVYGIFSSFIFFSQKYDKIKNSHLKPIVTSN